MPEHTKTLFPHARYHWDDKKKHKAFENYGFAELKLSSDKQVQKYISGIDGRGPSAYVNQNVMQTIQKDGKSLLDCCLSGRQAAELVITCDPEKAAVAGRMSKGKGKGKGGAQSAEKIWYKVIEAKSIPDEGQQ
eukprot:gene7710-3361_t